MILDIFPDFRSSFTIFVFLENMLCQCSIFMKHDLCTCKFLAISQASCFYLPIEALEINWAG
jgi:hypothetical protein